MTATLAHPDEPVDVPPSVWPSTSPSAWPSVHQAVGMVSIQLDTDVATAGERLYAYAVLAGRSVEDVAADIVARRLRLTD